MKRILVPIDGSEAALETLRGVLRRGPARVHSIDLVNVQPLLPQYIARFVPKRAREAWRAERGATTLAPAIRLAEASGLPYRTHVLKGRARQAVANAAQAWGCDEIALAPRARPPRAAWLALPAGLGLLAWIILD